MGCEPVAMSRSSRSFPSPNMEAAGLGDPLQLRWMLTLVIDGAESACRQLAENDGGG